MKRFISLTVCLVLLLSVFSINANAAMNIPQGYKDAVYNAIYNMQSSVDVSAYNIPYESDRIYDFLYYMRYDCPELHYYLDENNCTFEAFYKNGQWYVKTINFAYLFTKSELVNTQKRINDEINRLLPDFNSAWTDYEKVLYVHDRMAVEYQYDMRLFKENEKDQTNYDIYGLFTEKTGVCNAYALAFLYIMRLCGIECEYVLRDDGEHCWNVVKLGGKWYHIDVTHDDPIVSQNLGNGQVKYSDYDCMGRVSHSYFLISDDSMYDHTKIGWSYPFAEENISCTSDYSTVTRGATSAAIPMYQYWFYVDYDAGGIVWTEDFKTETLVYKLDKNWFMGTYSYGNYFTGLFKYNGNLIFSDSKTVYYYHPFTGKTGALAQFNDNSSYGYILGNYLDGKTMYFILDEYAYYPSVTIGAYTLCQHGHPDETDWVVTKNNGLYVKGEKVKYCTLCGEVSSTQVIDWITLGVLDGDVNGDGIVNVEDLANLKLYLSGNNVYISGYADIDKSGSVDIEDLATLKLRLVGVFPI